MDKRDLIDQLADTLREEAERLEQAARATYEGAIHPESAAEDKYDTRGLEASYLAGAQAKRVKELRSAMGVLRTMGGETFGESDPIRPGALVEIEKDDGERSLVLLALAAGGTTAELDGRTVRLVTPTSPLGAELLGCEAGDFFDLELPGGVRGYEVVSVG